MGWRRGGITRHLNATYRAVIRWLEHERGKSNTDTNDALLLSLAMENEEEPEQPEILRILRQQRRYDVPYIAGPLRDYPVVFLMELDTCVNAEIEFNSIQAANIRSAMSKAGM